MTETTSKAGRVTAGDWSGTAVDAQAPSFPWVAFLVSGIFGMAFGAAVLIWPDVSLRIMGALAGVWLVLAGVARIIGAFLPGGGSIVRHVLSGIVGIVVLVAGLVCLRNLVSRLALLALIFAIMWILSGLAELVLGLAHVGSARVGLIVVGVLSMLVGVVFLVTPNLSLALLVLMTGVGSFVVGLAEVVLAFYLRKATAAVAG